MTDEPTAVPAPGVTDAAVDQTTPGAQTAPAAVPTTWTWPDDLKVAAVAKGWDRVENPHELVEKIARSHAHAEKMLHSPPERVFRIPDQGAPAESWNMVHAALGRPDTPEGYKIEKPKDLPESFPYDESLIKSRLPFFHKHNMPTATVQALSDELHSANLQAMQAHEAEISKRIEAADAALRKEWGAEYDSRMAYRDRVLQRYGGDKLAEWLNSYDYDRTFSRVLASIGKDISEDGPTTSGFSVQRTPQDELQALIADKDFRAKLGGMVDPGAKQIAMKQWEDAIKRVAQQKEG